MHNIELSCPAASAQPYMEFSIACPTSRRPPRGQLQRFVTSPPHDGGDLPSGLPPRANSLPLFPAAVIGTLPTLQNRFPELQFLCPTGTGPISFPHCTNCPLPQALTRHFWPLISRRHFTYPISPPSWSLRPHFRTSSCPVPEITLLTKSSPMGARVLSAPSS